jgi:hypothetical protein
MWNDAFQESVIADYDELNDGDRASGTKVVIDFLNKLVDVLGCQDQLPTCNLRHTAYHLPFMIVAPD